MTQNPHKHIIVIGAGIAGLTATKLLHEDGFEVQILEAKNRIGGRTHSIQLGKATVDTGASWIHYQKGNPLSFIAQAYDLEMVTDEYEANFLWDRILKKDLSEDSFNYYKEAERARNEAIRFFEQNRGNDKCSHFIHQYLEHKKWNRKQKQIVQFIFKAMLETDYAAPSEAISLSDERYLNTFASNEENDARLMGCFQSITNILSEGLDIQLDTPVSTINYEGDLIKITTNKGIFTCDKLIITVSLGVLKSRSIRFTPALADSKQNAIDAFAFGNLENVILTFDEAFWGNKKFTIPIGNENKSLVFPCICDFSETAACPTLKLYYSAHFATKMQAKDDQTIVDAALRLLKNIFGKEDIKPIHTYVSRWSSDPYFLGSYSYSNSDDVAQNIEALAEPIANKIFFAGEATSLEGQAYVHGALLSGIREAKRLGVSFLAIKGLEKYFHQEVV